MFIRKYLLPLIAACGFAFAVILSLSYKEPPTAQAVAVPASTSFQEYISGAGIIEANTENIAVAPEIAGVVKTVYVQVGAQVKTGDPLFLIEDDAARAELALREREVASAKALVAEMQVSLADAQSQSGVAATLAEKSVGSTYNRDRKAYAQKVAAAKLESARQQVAASEAQLQLARTNLERLTVRAPVDGEILKLNARPGEYAPTGVLDKPLVMMGGIDPLHVRVDIDENDAWRFKEGAKAEGALRGNHELKTPLTFVRSEPYVTPKKSLTGESTERVDTRVLQVIFSFPAGNIPSYVGQQMDVFVEVAQ